MHPDTSTFLEAVYGAADGYVWTLWTLPDHRTYWLSTDDINPTIPDGHCTYCSLALATEAGEPHKRIRAEDAAAIVGFVADVDYGKVGAPPTEADAHTVLRDLPFPPTLLVHSGHGLQAWWLFKEPWVFEDEAERRRAMDLSHRWQVLVTRAASYRGWSVDPVGDLARVMRIPGTVNYKDREHPVPVRLLSADGPRFAPDDLEGVAPAEAPPPDAQRLAPVRMDGEFPVDRHEALLENCPEYAKSWKHERKDLRDQSASAYDMSLCSMAARAGWSDEELAALIRAHRKRFGETIKADRADYVARTVARARNGAALEEREEEAAQQLADPTEPLPRSKLVEQIGVVFGLPISNIQRFMATSPILRFTVGDRTVEIPQENLMDQPAWRKRMFVLCDRPPKFIPKGASPPWEKLLERIIEAAETIDLGTDGTVDGEMAALLREYLMAHPPEQKPAGEVVFPAYRPFVRDGLVWFGMRELLQHLNAGGGVKLQRRDLTHRLRAMGAVVKVHACRNTPKGSPTTARYYGMSQGIMADGVSA